MAGSDGTSSTSSEHASALAGSAAMPLNQRIDTSTRPLAQETDASKLPKITVITPSFNQCKYLEQTIQSVLDQRYPNLEWIVVDGGSKDGSVELIKRNESHFAWWISEKDRNHPHALNKGYEKATGEICCFVNSDDLLEPGALHYAARAFAKPGVNWIVGWAKFFDNSGDEWVYGPQSWERPIDMLLHNPVPQISSIWRTEAFRKVGGFTEKVLWAFDYEYWLRLYFVAGWRPVAVRRCLGAFRLHVESKSCSAPEKYVPDFEKLHEEYGKYLTPAERKQFAREQRKLRASRAALDTWEALKRNDVPTARRQALRSVRGQTFSMASWRALMCAVRGH
jgi:glycosyltransferase involved in cell wall biosynthesis